jgi:hypothetical protein
MPEEEHYFTLSLTFIDFHWLLPGVCSSFARLGWLKYLDLGFAKGLWRKLSDQSQTFNPSEDEEKRSLWQLFPTYIMAKDHRAS